MKQGIVDKGIPFLSFSTNQFFTAGHCGYAAGTEFEQVRLCTFRAYIRAYIGNEIPLLYISHIKLRYLIVGQQSYLFPFKSISCVKVEKSPLQGKQNSGLL